MRPLHALVATAVALATNPAFAQATAPAADSGGASWLWILLILALVAAAAWYFMRRRSLTSRTTGISHDRVADSAEQAKGSIKEGVGSLIGDTKLQAEGRADKVEGKVQNTYGGVKDTLRGQ